MRVSRFAVTMLLAGLAGLLAVGCSGPRWHYSYDLAMRSAVDQNRRAVVIFTTGSNPQSRELDWKVLNDSRVKEMLREFVPVRQDFFLNRPEAEELGVTQVPAVVMVRPDGSIAGSKTGEFTPESFRFFLINHRFN